MLKKVYTQSVLELKNKCRELKTLFQIKSIIGMYTALKHAQSLSTTDHKYSCIMLQKYYGDVILTSLRKEKLFNISFTWFILVFKNFNFL